MADFTRVVDFMNGLDKYHVKGASCVVIHHGKEVFRNYVGVMNDEGKPVDDNTLFRIYSMSKPITVVAALQLLEKGCYMMNEEVGKYIPAFWDMKVAKLKDNGAYGWYNPSAKRAVTIRDIFTMTAGLSYGGCYHPADVETSRKLDELAKKTDNKYTTREFADMMAETPLLFEPGEYWNYSYCLDVLGALVEVWSGERFGDYLKKHIFEPLGMKDTAFVLPDEKKDRLTSFWEYNFNDDSYRVYGETDRPFYMSENFEGGGAGLISSLDDYALFAQMLCNLGTGANGARILSPATVNLMRKDHLTEQQRKCFDWEVLLGYSYGLGVRTLIDPTVAGNLANIGEFGWNGMAGTYLLVDPAAELVIVYMQQLYPSMEGQIQPRLRNIVYSCLDY